MFSKVLRNPVLARLFSTRPEKLTTSYYFRPGTLPLSHATVGQLVNRAADESGDTIAFVSCHQGIRKTFYEFKQLVDRLASGLVSLGLRKGDRVALCAPNVIEWPVVQFATAKAGFILVNVNPAYQSEELEYCLKQAGCRVFITVDEYLTQKYYEMLCSFVPELPISTSERLESARLPMLKSVVLLSSKSKSGTITFEELMNAGDSKSDKLYAELEQEVQFDDPVNIQFTSGTTGSPKGATLTHHGIINNMLITGRRLGYHEPEKPVLCCQVPLYHAFGSVMGVLSSLVFHFPCVFPSLRYNATETLKAIEDEKCTMVYGTPTMFVDMLKEYTSGNWNINSLKQVLIAGATCPEVVLRDLRSKMNIPSIHIGYGCTENNPVVAVHSVDEDPSKVLSRLIPGVEYVEFKVIDENGKVLPVNTQGELCVRGHVLFHSYWNQPEKTAEVVDEMRWFHTGDLVKMNEEGDLEIVGRLKDMIIRGGENIYPQEIENFLHKHPAILQAHICGVPDERMGEELCAWIQLEDGETLTAEDMKSYCKGKISHFKIPRYIVFVDEYPKTVSGKVQKFKMREESIKLLQL